MKDRLDCIYYLNESTIIFINRHDAFVSHSIHIQHAFLLQFFASIERKYIRDIRSIRKLNASKYPDLFVHRIVCMFTFGMKIK